jgi:predicted PurR-regulated permease PerM
MRTIDLTAISQQLLSLIQPLLARTGDLVGTLAGGAVEVFGWTLFILTVSYFVMAESKGVREDIVKIEIPGYTEDLRRLGSELSRIWNAFLRGQIIIFVLTVVIYSILLPAMSVRYALGLAFMAGLAKFLPYIGPAITWVVMGVITFFQPFKPFDLNPLLYTGIVVIAALIVDQVMDTLITPRIMARTLKVHPAAVLVAALIAANLLGLLGVVIAAPFLATILLLGRYVMRKMFDLDPWPPMETILHPPVGTEWIARIKQLRRSFIAKRQAVMKSDKENSDEQ